MRDMIYVFMILSSFAVTSIFAQNFDPTPIPFAPSNVIAFKMNLPITHLDINNYVPSTRGVYAGRVATFKFYNRDNPEPLHAHPVGHRSGRFQRRNLE